VAKVGSSTDCTRSSDYLAKVGNERGNNQSSPGSLGTYPTWTVTRMDWYQCYLNIENSSNYQSNCGQDGNLLTKVNHLRTL